MNLPRIYLAIDNCFASKRWTEPEHWMTLCSDLGVKYVEASADTECDPLYTTPDYINDWAKKVLEISETTGVHISNLYSGHGTYATLGLAHNDPRIREHILKKWLMPMADTAAELNAGLGFFCHAFSEDMLKSKKKHQDALNNLYHCISEITRYASKKNLKFICTEQMYSPHQFPWTIDTATDFMKNIYSNTGAPMYITVDTGHSSGQRTFIKPTRSDIKTYIACRRNGKALPSIWAGSAGVYDEIEKVVNAEAEDIDVSIDRIMDVMKQCDHMFATPEDGDPYVWLRKHGCYSPVIHLQQTDGSFSKHLPFTAANNSSGIIHGKQVLQALKESYLVKPEDGMPPKCEKIYLTLEVFSGTAEKNVDIKSKIKASIDYWRQFIPEDGMDLGSLISSLN